MKKVTRESNKNFKGGELHTKYDKQPTADVQAEKAALTAEKVRKGKSQAQGAQRVAQLEHDALQKAAAQRAKPGSVYTASAMQKKEHKCPRSAGSQDKELPLKRKKTVSKVVYVEVTDDEDMESDPGHESNNDSGQILESDDSGEEFIPGENEDESDEDIEMEGKEPDTVIERKKKRKGKTAGKKKGVTARGRIRELRDGMSTLPGIPGAKQIPSKAKSQKKKSKGKGKGEPSGLRSNWDEDTLPLLPFGPVIDAEEHTEDDEGPAQQEGGYVDNDEVEFQKSMSSQYKARLTAKIEQLANAPKIFKKASKTSKRPKVGDLPQEARANWRFFKVTIVNSASQLGPWEDISDHTIEKNWNAMFENKGSCLIGRTMYRGRDSYEHFLMVKALTRNQVLATEWKNWFAAAGIEAVTAEWDRQDLNTIEEKKEWVERMLGPEPTNRQSKKRPFLWQATDSEEWKGEDPNTAGGGLFLGQMVLKVFVECLDFVSDVPAEHAMSFTSSSKPCGALMMAIQAVNRALEYSLTGQVKIPPGNNKTGHFSEDNWRDYEKLTTVDGKEYRKQVKQATVFAKTIDAMDEQRWAKIIKAAKAYVRKRDPDRFDRAKVSAAPLLDAKNSSDDEILHDTMFDTLPKAPTASNPKKLSTTSLPAGNQSDARTGVGVESGLMGDSARKEGLPNLECELEATVGGVTIPGAVENSDESLPQA
ncbi:hypothetical protein EST38_g13943 [Candolleomyces aberdarensis]|uniref:Uncharacterized protein n=1 Tax=Candolleomyces aberdarensis TaxID=2316362 RepID=A0A4Q2CYR1_9AGAR|nr:hypothetical protein EST38_g13943 [Candolleomyces aberdarensis]